MPVRNRAAPDGVPHLLLEPERRLVRLPARDGRREPLREVGAHVEPAVPGAAAEPLDRAADREVDPERRDVDRDDPGRLVAVEDHVRPHLVRPAHDRLDVLDLGGLEEDVADRDEQGPLVDRVEDRPVVLADDDVELRLGLVEVAHRREVLALVDDPVATRVGGQEAREDDRLRDGDVLVHHGRAGRSADDPADLVADRHRRGPPALAPRADPALGPHRRVLREAVRRPPRHRRQRVVDQVRRVLEDRELGPVVEQLAHLGGSVDAGQLTRLSSPSARWSQGTRCVVPAARSSSRCARYQS